MTSPHPQRRLVFDINDFDETLPGPWEWDVKRLAASFEIGARDRGFKKVGAPRVVLAAAREYRQAMRELSGMSNLDVWNAHVDVEDPITRYGHRLRREIGELSRGT